MIPLICRIDQTILMFVQSTWHYPMIDKIMIIATGLGNEGLIWILVSLILLLNEKTRVIGMLTLASLLLATIAGEGIIKQLVQRPRPYDDYPGIQLLIDLQTTFSFPSGHTTSSFAAAYILGRYLKKYSRMFWAVAIIIAFSRLYLFLHYPTDILGGMLLGLACGKVVTIIYEKKLRPAHDEKSKVFL